MIWMTSSGSRPRDPVSTYGLLKIANVVVWSAESAERLGCRGVVCSRFQGVTLWGISRF